MFLGQMLRLSKNNNDAYPRVIALSMKYLIPPDFPGFLDNEVGRVEIVHNAIAKLPWGEVK